jgi:predicted enzyme related to lactoylglutathione lyase
MSTNLKLSHVIEYVADMGAAVKFYRDVVGLRLLSESPGWTEFATGETSLALHPASAMKPAGKIELGFTVDKLPAFHQEMKTKGVKFSMEPAKQEWGRMLAQFVDSEGTDATVSAQI